MLFQHVDTFVYTVYLVIFISPEFETTPDIVFISEITN